MKLYAKFRSDGSDIKISDKFESKAVLLDQKAINDIYQNGGSVGTFLSLVLGIPILLCPLFAIVYMKGARRQIRIYLRDPNHHASLGAMVSISVIFSLFVFAMDITAIVYAYSPERNELTKHSNDPRSIPTFPLIIVVFCIDLVALLVAIVELVFLTVLEVCLYGCSETDTCFSCCFKCCFLSIFCCGELQTSDRDHQNEQKVWLLMMIFVAPFIALATHVMYIIVALIQYPSHAGAISIVYILTFLYHFVTYKFVYLFLSDNEAACCKSCTNSSTKDEEKGIKLPQTEMDEHVVMEKGNFRVWKVWLIIVFGVFACGFEIWFIAGLVNLPIAEIIDDAPVYIYTFRPYSLYSLG